LRGLRQQRERVDVALLVRGNPNAEMDVRLGPLGLPARSDRRDGSAFGDRVALANGEPAQVLERDCVAVGGSDRKRLPSSWNRARERHRARGRRSHRSTEVARNVDAAVLAGRIGVAPQDERLQHLSLDRPGPGLGGSRQEPGQGDHEQNPRT